MNLHIFNPGHDSALAVNVSNYAAPHAARQLETDLGFLPVLWADDGDVVLVNDVAQALRSIKQLRTRLDMLKGGGVLAKEPLFVTEADLANVDIDENGLKVLPWGWDKAVKHRLVSVNANLARVCPDDNILAVVREMSSRRFASRFLLPALREEEKTFVGESRCFTSDANLMLHIKGQRGGCVLKSLWSSSGRGVRYVNPGMADDQHLIGWCRNVIRQQGGIMAEPYYNKVADFGMEFECREDGVIEYLGLSVFRTTNGAYTGNVVAGEAQKEQMLSKYFDTALLDVIRSNVVNILSPHLKGIYTGPFGVDMMAVRDADTQHIAIHPCVEMNLRRTMGHVALALTPESGRPDAQMGIMYDDKFHLRIDINNKSLLNTGIVRR